MQNYFKGNALPKDWDANKQVYHEKLKIPDQRQIDAFQQYQIFVNYAYQMDKLDSILEIGSGLSTILLAMLAHERKCNFYSVDVNFDRVMNSVRGTDLEGVVKNNVNFMKGTSITKDEFVEFYKQDGITTFAKISISDISQHLDDFIKVGADKRKLIEIGTMLKSSLDAKTLKDLFIYMDSFRLRKDILNIYSQTRSFVDEYKFFERKDIGTLGVIDALLEQVNTFDLIFFDSGEFSSNVEFQKLKDYVRPGGLAVFHDIYFPKSYKNFLVCSAVKADSSWEVIYQDEDTPQGLMMAVRR